MNAQDRTAVLKLNQQMIMLDALFLRVDRQENLEQKEAAWEQAFDYYKLVRLNFTNLSEMASGSDKTNN